MVQEGGVAVDFREGAAPFLQTDSIVAGDTLQAEPVYGLILEPPASPAVAPPREGGSEGVSYILGGLFILFLIIALRFRNNFKYVFTMFRNLVETRTRQNVFNDTVRETSLIVLLNILWCACAGIIGFCVFQYFHPDMVPWQHRAVGMLLGMGIAVAYTLCLWWSFTWVGWVFSDRIHAELWVKGFSASQALMAPAFFLTALIGISNPESVPNVGIVSGIVFILVKIVFIWKGYRIFFNQISSWVLFLCYLCSLEIVPLILSYRCALLLGEML
ncbi:MAG: DUF4271 domain-containing protein [Muribaculaceae bacterium]|nr:DUF4271 domain-containing protein [Muribaculaceae bacterium]